MITIEGLSKRFIREGRDGISALEVLDDINLTIRDGEFVCLIGPSGCGKTTLLKMIDGLLPFDSGEIRLDGQPVRAPGPDRAMVFQDFALLPGAMRWPTSSSRWKPAEWPQAIGGSGPGRRSGSWASRGSSTTCRTSSRAACSSGWAWLERW